MIFVLEQRFKSLVFLLLRLGVPSRCISRLCEYWFDPSNIITKGPAGVTRLLTRPRTGPLAIPVERLRLCSVPDGSHDPCPLPPGAGDYLVRIGQQHLLSVCPNAHQ